MKRDKGLINTTMIKSDVRRFWWAGAIYFFSILFMVIMPLTGKGVVRDFSLMFSNERMRYGFIRLNLIVKLLYITVAAGVVFSIIIFSFMNRKGRNEFVFRLPIKRSGVFLSKCISAFYLFIIPFIVSGGIIFTVLYAKRGESVIQNGGMIYFKVIGLIFLCGILSFFTTSMIGMLSSSSIATGVFTGVFMFFPVAIEQMIVSTVNIWAIGTINVFEYKVRVISFIFNRIQPILSQDMIYFHRYFDVVEGKFEDRLVINIILCIIAYAGIAFLLFKFRKNESVGNTITFKWFRPILKYGFSLCVMIVMLIILCDDYLSMTFKGKVGTYIISGGVAYIVAVWFLEKSVKGILKRKNLIGLCVYSSLIFIVCLGYESNIFDVQGFGFIKNKVESIDVILSSSSDDMSVEMKFSFRDKENLKKIYELTKESISYIHENIEEIKGNYDVYDDNGYLEVTAYGEEDIIRMRRYPLYLTEKTIPLIRELFESDERKSSLKGKIQSEDIRDIEYGFHYNNVELELKSILDRKTIDEIIEAYKSDLDEIGFEDLGRAEAVMDLKLGGKIAFFNGRYNFWISVKSCHKNLLDLLKEKGIYRRVYPEFDNIQEIQIRDLRYNTKWVSVFDQNTKKHIHNVVTERNPDYMSNEYERIGFRFIMKDDGVIIQGKLSNIIVTPKMKTYLQ